MKEHCTLLNGKALMLLALMREMLPIRLGSLQENTSLEVKCF